MQNKIVMFRNNTDESVQDINVYYFSWISESCAKASRDMVMQIKIFITTTSELMMMDEDNTRSKCHQYIYFFRKIFQNWRNIDI
jgi:hypothetical protein